MRKVIIIGVALALVTVGLLYFVSRMKSGILENIALTQQLSPALIEQLKENQAKDLPYMPAAIEWEGKYLVIDYATIETEKYGYLFFSYNKELNEKLNTDRFFPGNDINGVVWIYSDSKIVGEYSSGGYAAQPYYLLFFLDLDKNAVLARDTVWGGMPPQTISAGQSGGVGKFPNNDEVVATISNQLSVNSKQ